MHDHSIAVDAPPSDPAGWVDDEVLSLLTRRPAPAQRPTAAAAALTQAQVGRLGGFDIDDAPLLESGLWSPAEWRRARTTVALESGWIGVQVVFVLENGDSYRPIVIGVVHELGSVLQRRAAPGPFSVTADEQRVHLRAAREIVLECGAASITLTRAGKVIIKGAHVVSTSSGSNRIKGAVIDIN